MSERREEKAGSGDLGGRVGETTETRYFWKDHNKTYDFIYVVETNTFLTIVVLAFSPKLSALNHYVLFLDLSSSKAFRQ